MQGAHWPCGSRQKEEGPQTARIASLAQDDSGGNHAGSFNCQVLPLACALATYSKFNFWSARGNGLHVCGQRTLTCRNAGHGAVIRPMGWNQRMYRVKGTPVAMVPHGMKRRGAESPGNMLTECGGSDSTPSVVLAVTAEIGEYLEKFAERQ